ncbi:hypothetical protein [Nocardioides sp. 616]|uniref:hypothetical protein n=1 Tax=Nocardioides sp. 616 TaxID=2268090 RepID=UPI000CE46DB4|nr:hypothetical protein [Nocardioides sp. 616]
MRIFLRVSVLGTLSSLPLGGALGLVLGLLQTQTQGVSFPLWIVGVLFSTAVVMHEMGHGLALGVLRMPVEAVRMHWGGLSIEVGEAPPLQRLVAAAAGPLTAALSGCLCIVVWAGAPAAGIYLVLGLAHGLTLLMPSGDARAVLASGKELRRGLPQSY